MLTPIPNIGHYTSEMRKSLLDKAFFVDKVLDTDTFVDYGCGDGLLIKFIKSIFPEFKFVGFDLNPEMIKLANTNCPNTKFFSNWDELVNYISNYKVKPALVCSSLIHEVYSYCHASEIAKFWEQIYNPMFSHVIIRDMSINKHTYRASDNLSVIRIRHKASQKHLKDFENVWGSIDFNNNMVHYLLKYRYEDNWTHEVLENYLPLTFEDLISLIPKNRKIDYIDHYTLPFVKSSVKNDFGIDLIDNTHVKIIIS